MDKQEDVRNFNQEMFEYDLLDSNCDNYELLVDTLTQNINIEKDGDVENEN
jgi:hypothetical protein